jgi:hypothetical protein
MTSTPSAPPPRTSALPRTPSLARLLNDYAERWEIERVERSTEWVAVLRDTSGDYIRIIGAHDLGALRYKIDEAEHDEPGDHETASSR